MQPRLRAAAALGVALLLLAGAFVESRWSPLGHGLVVRLWRTGTLPAPELLDGLRSSFVAGFPTRSQS